MRFGCCVWTICWKAPYEDAIKRIARLGFKGVELIAWDKKTLDEYYTPKKIRELKELVSSLGMEITEFVSTPRGMSSLRKEDQDEALSHFKRLVEVASDIGTKIVNTVAPWPFSDMPSPDIKRRPLMQTFLMPENLPYDLDMDLVWNSYVSLMKKFADLVEDAGMRYAIEPHPFRLICNADGMLRLIEHVGSKAIGMNWDPSHLFPSGETPAISILRLKGRIFHTHISDNDAATNVHWRPGKGKIDWKSCLKAMKAIGYDNVLSLELEDAPGASSQNGPRNAEQIFDMELNMAMSFLEKIAEEVNIKIEK
ncbi:MAG: sugar phosphate isomerase/epimerase [Candidatus Bathyarchaeia archaeon]